MEEQSKNRKVYTPKQAKLKAENYCVYQERAQQEVRDKLYLWGLHHNDVEEIIADLISENFLNEERFAVAYAQGKLRMQGWGKIKIKQHLKFKRVSEPLIKIAINKINQDEYYEILQKIISKRTKEDISSLSILDKNKLIKYLQSKGFENTLIFELVTL